MNLDPTTVYGTIFWGVMAGIVTSALLFILGLFISKVILPWYQELVYRGVDLRGTWTEEHQKDSAKYLFQISIEQNAHTVSGTATMFKSGTGKDDYVQGFNVDGFTWEGFVLLNLRSTERKSLSFATALLKVKDRGNTLKGSWAYRGRWTDEVESEDIKWERKK